MSVYREIPLSFGTLLLLRPKADTSANLQHRGTLDDTACDFKPPGGRSENGALDFEASSLSSDDSAFEQEMTVADDNHQPNETYSPLAKFGFYSKPSPPTSLWSGATYNGTSSNREVKIGPTTRGTTTAQKPFACNVCGRPFRRKKDIRRHMSTHSNDKPYYCWACCLSFRSQEYLRRHFKRVHLQGGSSGEPRSNLHHEGQQRSTEELSASNQSVIEPVRDTPREQHSSDTPPLSQDRHAAEAEVALDDGSDDEPMATRKAKTATGSSPKTVGPPGTALGTQKPASPTTRPRSSAADPGKSKDTLSVYLCDGCGHLVLQNHAMVLGNKQPGHSAKPLVLCKVCFIKKTGIICID